MVPKHLVVTSDCFEQVPSCEKRRQQGVRPQKKLKATANENKESKNSETMVFMIHDELKMMVYPK